MKNSEHEPLDGEVNPNHPMTKFARSQWHKICALLMQKLETDEVEITVAEIDRLDKRNMAVVIHESNERLFIRFLPMAEAEELARKAGGMPA